MPTEKKNKTHTSSLFKDHENTHTHLLPFQLKFENTTDWEVFQCLTGAVLITFGFVSPKKSGNRSKVKVGTQKIPR